MQVVQTLKSIGTLLDTSTSSARRERVGQGWPKLLVGKACGTSVRPLSSFFCVSQRVVHHAGFALHELQHLGCPGSGDRSREALRFVESTSMLAVILSLAMNPTSLRILSCRSFLNLNFLDLSRHRNLSLLFRLRTLVSGFR